MYIHDFICTYKSHGEKTSEDAYRLQYLQAFGINNWDDMVIDKESTVLFDKISKNKDMMEIINKIKETKKFKGMLAFLGDDHRDLFKLLFVYDLFDLSHKCFCDILNDGNIREDNKNMLLKNI